MMFNVQERFDLQAPKSASSNGGPASCGGCGAYALQLVNKNQEYSRSIGVCFAMCGYAGNRSVVRLARLRLWWGWGLTSVRKS